MLFSAGPRPIALKLWAYLASNCCIPILILTCVARQPPQLDFIPEVVPYGPDIDLKRKRRRCRRRSLDLALYEADAIAKGGQGAYLLRTLLSEGEIRHETVERAAGKGFEPGRSQGRVPRARS